MVETSTRHVLDPLTGDEIAAAVAIVRAERGLTGPHRFSLVTLDEPRKGETWHLNGAERDRRALVVVLDSVARSAFEAVVSLAEGRIVAWKPIEAGQPSITAAEFGACEETVRADPQVREVLRRRGVEQFELVWVDPWSTGHYVGQENDRRLSRCLLWVQNDPDDDNGYAHPIEHLAVNVDLHEMRVVSIEEGEPVPIPRQEGNFGVEDVGPMRDDLKPLAIVQSDGPSFEIDGNEVRWQKWQLRLGFTPREGLVLHEVAWNDGERVRPILYRASVSEMVVPYGDPDMTHSKKNAFDVGEYNIGALANSLTLGCDCLGEIRYLDAVMVGDDGVPFVLENAICLHEEDYGVLWRHWNWRTDAREIRRSRRLVISFWSTVGNYDYGFFWYLYQDGTIQAEVKLTGILSTGAVPPGTKPRYGQLLNADGLYAPIHQHFFSYRLDLDVDGPRNVVLEEHAEVDTPGAHNPLDAGFYMVSTRLERESEAQQLCDPLRARSWKVINPERLNAVGEPVGYRLVPHGNVLPFAAANASVTARARFATKHLWVTPYAPDEFFAAGAYPNQHPGEAGLPAWTAADRPIAETDVVLWYTLGVHHQARTEEWPVMPCGYAGFVLQPSGFFDHNPALDVPPPVAVGANGHCHT